MPDGFDRSALIAHQRTAERYRHGITEEMQEYLSERGIDRELAARFMLGRCDDLHDGWLSIPYLRPSGTIWFNYRRLDGGSPKYKASGSRHLFNTVDLDIADRTGEIAIAEGELDCIVASGLCDVPCVGVPGATQWTGNKPWHQLFTGYQVVWVLADPDEAGLKLAAEIMEVLPRARLAKLPGDVNETYLQHGEIRRFLR